MARLKSTLVEKVKKEVGSGEFILVKLEGTELKPIYDHRGELLTFKTGDEASKEAKKLSDKDGAKVQPRRIVDKEWRAREQKRMDDGTYRLLPWHKEAWWEELAPTHRDHFPHASLNKGSFIAFTESEDKGSADIQTSLRPGRYLERFFGAQLNKHAIRDLCCIFAKTFEDNKLQIVNDPDDMEEIFLSGPTSCMSKEASAYKTKGTHPIRAYAAGDLSLAYFRRNGRIAARCIVWPDKKLYNTIYGDKGLMEPLLRKEGYRAGPPVGARLLKIPLKGDKGLTQYVLPHVDGVGWVKDGGKDMFLVGDPSSNLDADYGINVPGGAGLSEPIVGECEACKREALALRYAQQVYVDSDNAKAVYRCKSCAQKTTVQCAVSGYWVDKEHAVKLGGKGNRMVWKRYLKSGEIFRCDGTGQYYTSAEKIVLPDGRVWSAEYWSKKGGFCNLCGTKVEVGFTCSNPAKCTNLKTSRPQLSVNWSDISSSTATWAQVEIPAPRRV